MTSPKSYGLPHDNWRPHQKEALDLILNMPDTQTLILEAPTGFGKSGLCAAVGHTHPVLSMVATRDLQQQYADIYDFSVIWGRSHYSCTKKDKVNRWLHTYGFAPNADDCTDMKTCTISCPYKQAKAIAAKDVKTVMNYHYGWYSEWWHHRGGYLFADEAHNLAISVISNLAQLRVSERQRRLWDLPRFPACSGTTTWAVEQVDEWLNDSMPILRSALKDLGESKDKSKGTLLLRKLQLLRELIWQGTWHVKGTNIDKDPYLICRPINPSAFADRLLGQHSKRVLMSATIGDASMLAQELGIVDYKFHSFEHNIPSSQRPVYLTDAPAMSFRSRYADYEHQSDIIAAICYQHKGERILIHTTRWKHARDLANRLARKGLQDRVWVPEQGLGRIKQIAKLLDESYTNLIAIGPSFWEGLDLRGGLCRAVIVAKIPFADRSDPVVAARLRQDGGQQWDRWIAALRVVQGCGRAVRDADDFAVAYIADANWGRVAKFAPSWFQIQT